jgi:hypothetical protein
MTTLFLGLVCEEYTPQVEGQLTRDIIATQSQLQPGDTLCLCFADHQVERLCLGLGIEWTADMDLAQIMLVYRTSEYWPEVEYKDDVPKTEIRRDLYMGVNDQKLSQTDRPAYYLSPQGRITMNQIGVLRPAPNGYSQPDSFLNMLWDGC